MNKAMSIFIGLMGALVASIAVGAVATSSSGAWVIVICSVALFAWAYNLWRRQPASQAVAQATARKLVGILVGLAALAVVIYVVTLPSTLKTHVEKETIAESYQQYLLVKRAGNLQDTCTYAGVVVFAMIQAKDEKGYQDWKEIQRNDCAVAGMKIPQ